jgi:tetratricopeptide (TPR) repeat protein
MSALPPPLRLATVGAEGAERAADDDAPTAGLADASTTTVDGARGWTLRQACRIARLAPATVRALMDAGVVQPVRNAHGSLLFSFRDLSALRGLRDVPGSRLRRTLLRLRGAAGRRLVHRGARLLVHETDGTLWDAETGQLALPLADAGAEHAAACVFVATDGAREIDWFARATELEEHDPPAAVLAYRAAVTDAPSREEAWLNLGALLHELGRHDEAAAAYESGLAALPASALLHFNHGVLLHAQGRLREALAAYRRALTHESALADAHHNAALVCIDLRETQHAVRHINAFRRLEPQAT